ncbi:MAG: hypothetical protein ABI430_03330 [Candidatus Taylorbacteria bacterium]
MNTDSRDEPSFDWGVQAERTLPLTDSSYTCPLCLQFSYGCMIDCAQRGAMLWFDAVIGFTTSPIGKYVGIAVLCCKHCGGHFGVPLTTPTVLGYIAQNSRWQSALREKQ